MEDVVLKYVAWEAPTHYTINGLLAHWAAWVKIKPIIYEIGPCDNTIGCQPDQHACLNLRRFGHAGVSLAQRLEEQTSVSTRNLDSTV